MKSNLSTPEVLDLFKRAADLRDQDMSMGRYHLLELTYSSGLSRSVLLSPAEIEALEAAASVEWKHVWFKHVGLLSLENVKTVLLLGQQEHRANAIEKASRREKEEKALRDDTEARKIVDDTMGR